MYLPGLRPITLILLGIAFTGTALRQAPAPVVTPQPKAEATEADEVAKISRIILGLIREGGEVGSVSQLADT